MNPQVEVYLVRRLALGSDSMRKDNDIKIVFRREGRVVSLLLVFCATTFELTAQFSGGKNAFPHRDTGMTTLIPMS